MNSVPNMHVVLIGLMGTGKTTVGKRLARELGCHFIDTDRVIEEQVGRTIVDIFATDGEATFRGIESKVLADALRSLEPTVIATGGGIVTVDDNRDALREAKASGVAHVVWLDATPERLHSRIGTGTNRPLLARDPLDVLTRLTTERRHFYESSSSYAVHTDTLGIDEVVDDIVRHLRRLGEKEVK